MGFILFDKIAFLHFDVIRKYINVSGFYINPSTSLYFSDRNA